MPGILPRVTVTLLVVAAVVAVLDWIAVDRRHFRVEYAAKPAVLALLVAVAASGDLGPAKTWIVAALALGLVGDVAIMLAAPRDTDRAFFVGLVAFLLGHVAYVIGFVRVGVHPLPLVAGLLVAAGIGGLLLPPVGRQVHGRVLATTAYSLAVGAMAGFAAGTELILVAAGGILFVVSDGVLARERFAKPLPRSPLLVAVSYHLAQFLVLGGLLLG